MLVALKLGCIRMSCAFRITLHTILLYPYFPSSEISITVAKDAQYSQKRDSFEMNTTTMVELQLTDLHTRSA
jgi:hypothetical protein